MSLVLLAYATHITHICNRFIVPVYLMSMFCTSAWSSAYSFIFVFHFVFNALFWPSAYSFVSVFHFSDVLYLLGHLFVPSRLCSIISVFLLVYVPYGCVVICMCHCVCSVMPVPSCLCFICWCGHLSMCLCLVYYVCVPSCLCSKH